MLARPWFLSALIVAGVHQGMQKLLNWHIPILDAYLDPLLFMPILLYLILWERRFFFKKGTQYVLPWSQMLAIFALVSILCEFFFPRWSTRFTMDYWDVLCYFLGMLLFGFVFNKPMPPGSRAK